MKCKKLREIYDRYMDGQLSDRERQDLENHIRDCPECAAEVKSMKRMNSLLQMAGKVEMPDEYWDNYWGRLEKKLPDQPAPVTFLSRISDLFAYMFRHPAIIGRVVVYVLVFAIMMYATSDEVIKTPQIHAPKPSTAIYAEKGKPAEPDEELARTAGVELEEGISETRLYSRSDVKSLDSNKAVDQPAAPSVKEQMAYKFKPSAGRELKSEGEVSLQLAPTESHEAVEEKKVEAKASPAMAQIQDQYGIAENYFEKGQYKEAIPAYQNFITANTTANVQDERTLKAVYQVGESYYQMGKYSDALSNFIAVENKAEDRTETNAIGDKLAKRKAVAMSAPASDQTDRGVSSRTRARRPIQRNEEQARMSDSDEGRMQPREQLISRAIFRQAQSYERLGNQKEAIAAYRRYAKNYPQGEFISQAREKISPKEAQSKTEE